MKIRRHIFFSGRVQGVGFRYRAYYAAEALGLTGWVKNLWDDRVEMEVQGDSASIDKMLSMLQEGHFIEIQGIEMVDMPLENDSSFRIR